MEIIVPLDKPPLPHPRSRFVSRVRTFAIFGFVGYVLLFSMIFSEGRVSFPHLQRTVQLVVVSFLGLLITWRQVRLGGAILAGGMIVALLLTPSQLVEWRPWFYAIEVYALLTGLLFLLAPRAPAKKPGPATT